MPYLNDVLLPRFYQHHGDETSKLLWLAKLRKQTAYIHYIVIVRAKATLF